MKMDITKAQIGFDKWEGQRQAIISQREALAEQMESLRKNQDSARNQLAIEDLQEQMAGCEREIRLLAPDLEDARAALRAAQIEVDANRLKELLAAAEPERIELIRMCYSLLLAAGQAWATERQVKTLGSRIPSERVISMKTGRLSAKQLFEGVRIEIFGALLEPGCGALLEELEIPSAGQMEFNQQKLLETR